MNRGPEPGHASPKPRFTQKQGQYLAFIDAYTLVLGRPPAEADLRRHFASHRHPCTRCSSLSSARDLSGASQASHAAYNC